MQTDQYHRILEYLRKTIEGTKWQGHVFAVGGCCRDEILGNEIKDVDLAVDLAGGGIGLACWFYENGLAVKEPVTFPSFGTAMLRLREFPDDEIEIVQTRAEKYTDRTRRGPTVVFGPIEQDCRRRDLTINALYYDISNSRLLDILGCSIDDIHNCVIRTPNDPDTTFDDDPVRILRAIRLASRYGWEIEPATFEGMAKNVHRLKIVRPERMQAEVEKMLVGPHPSTAMDLMRRCGAVPYIFPGLEELFDLRQGTGSSPDAWQFTMLVLDRTRPDLALRLAALLHDIAKPLCRKTGKNGGAYFPGHERRSKALIDTAMRRLHFDRKIIDRVIFLSSNHLATKTWGPTAENMTDAALRRLQYKCTTPRRFDMLMELIDADNKSYPSPQPEQVAAVRRRSEELQKEGMALFSFKHQVNMQRLRKTIGANPDDDMKPYLDFLLQLAINNPRMSRDKVLKELKKFRPIKKK